MSAFRSKADIQLDLFQGAANDPKRTLENGRRADLKPHKATKDEMLICWIIDRDPVDIIELRR
jgi:hypothetical protein